MKILRKISFLILASLIFNCKGQVKEESEDLMVLKFQSNNISEFKVQELTESELRKEIIFEGKFVKSKKWIDSQGENILLIYTKGPFEEIEFLETDDEEYVELYAQKFQKKTIGYEKTWEIKDFVRNCAYDMYIGLANSNSIYITDVNNDNLAEVSLVYYLSCRSDVSPSNMKLIMRSDKKKYALRGKTIPKSYAKHIDLNQFNPNLDEVRSLKDYDKDMGRYLNENDFSGSPKEFLILARSLWKKNVIEAEMKQF